MMDAVDNTPSRAAFLCSGTADFHPPEWACLPLEANAHARLEAFRDSRHCATYMVATKLVNIFGRDQEVCDHVLGNPSVSRKHAAIIHDNAGGIYMVDLMSRHGTYVGRKKIPPHDPYLLHEGDIIKFGQSIRQYILKGASSDGSSATVKKSWGRMKLRPPRVSISAVLPKKHSKPRVSAPVTKLVNDITYGTLSDEKVDAFVLAVMELSDEEKKEVADYLVEKIQAKYEFYAAHVHKNAMAATIALLKQNLCVEEFDENLAIITHISQQRHDSIYRKNARKLLQLMAAVRLDPDNIQYNDTDSVISNEDNMDACPPTAKGSRERVLSDEGKKLFLSAHEGPSNSNGNEAETTNGYPSHSYGGEYGRNGSDSDLRSNGNGYAPPTPWRGGTSYTKPRKYAQSASTMSDQSSSSARDGPSGFAFMGRSESDNEMVPTDDDDNAKSSAFGFISGRDADDDTSSHTSSTDRPSGQSSTGFDFMNRGTSRLEGPPKLPSMLPEDFLQEQPVMDPSNFEELWGSTDESEEWSAELMGAFDSNKLQSCFAASRIHFLSSDKVGGQQQWLFHAEQKSDGTIFLIDLRMMPGLSEMTISLKWIVNSLLYGNGHIIFLEIAKYALYQFGTQVQFNAVPSTHSTHQYSHQHQQYHPQSHGQLSAGQTARRKNSSVDEDGDDMSARDYLTEHPMIDAAKFEHVWANAPTIGTLSYTLDTIPDKDDVIELFSSNYLSCLASGSVEHFVKFYFFAEMVELQCVFCIELVIDEETGAVEGTIKRLALQSRTDDEEEQIDSSFVRFFEEVVQEL